MTEPVNDINNWRIEDPDASQPLDSIFPYSQRATALIARNRNNTILSTAFLQVAGAISMLKGLDYHHDRFMMIIGNLAAGLPEDADQLLHEAVAYINRAGQFYYFIESDLVRNNVNRLPTPKIDEIVKKFRHKHTAHRSIDKPRPEDTEDLQLVHAMTLSEFGGELWHPKESLPLGFAGPFWGKAYLVYQLHTGPQEVYELIIERDHDTIMGEAYAILCQLLT